MSETNEVQRVVIRPGAGWRRLSGAVYERDDGLRMHMLGYCRLPGSDSVIGDDFKNYRMQNRLIDINGGNKKRGLMAWANALASQALKVSIHRNSYLFLEDLGDNVRLRRIVK